MSYDLSAFPCPPGVAPADRWFQIVDDEENDRPTSTIIPPDERERLASRLERTLGLTRETRDYESLASEMQISIEEARRQFDYIELSGPEEMGLQISLYPGTVSITLPYWHKSSEAQAAFDLLGGIVRILRDEGGLTVFDPQLERALATTEDLVAGRAKYESTTVRMNQMISGDPATRSATPPPRRPWWKFW